MSSVGAPLSPEPHRFAWLVDSFDRTESLSSSASLYGLLPSGSNAPYLLSAPSPLSPHSSLPSPLLFATAACLADVPIDSPVGFDLFSHLEPLSPFAPHTAASSEHSTDDSSAYASATAPPSPPMCAADSTGHAQPAQQPLSSAYDTTATPPPEAAVARPRFLSRKVACQVCHFAKVRCEGGRPCERCIRHAHTQHCTDRPSGSRGEKRRRAQKKEAQPQRLPLIERRTELEEEVEADAYDGASLMRAAPLSAHSSIRHLPPPFSSRHQPVDSVRFSSHFVSGHIAWMAQLTAGELSGLIASMHLRDKLVQMVWMSGMLTPSDLSKLAHAAPLSANWWQHYFHPRHHPLLLDCYSALHFGRHNHSGDDSGGGECDGGSEASRGSWQARKESPIARAAAIGACDGSRCFGYCGFLLAMAEAASCRITWEHSPLLPLPDQPSLPSQAFVAVRRLRDDSLARRQEALVDALCDRMALDVAARRREDTHSAPASAALDESDALISASHVTVRSLEVRMSVQCNAAFERLLGYHQSELRELFSESGDKALFGLVSAEDWAALLQLDKALRLGWRQEGRLLVTAVDSRQQRVPCVLSVQSELDAKRKPYASYFTFTPLPADSAISRVGDSGITAVQQRRRD